MQNDPNRLSQKIDNAGRSSRDGAIFLAQDAIADTLLLNPNTPAGQLAEIIVSEFPANLRADLSGILIQQFIVREIIAQRRRITVENNPQLKLPGFEHLPWKIETPKGTRVRLLSANYARVRDYYWSLMKKYTARKRNDPKIKEAKALMEKMRKASKKDKGITVKEVLAWD